MRGAFTRRRRREGVRSGKWRRRRRLSQSPWRRKHTALPSRSGRPLRVSFRRPSSTYSPCHSYGNPDTASTSQATICRGGGCGVDGRYSLASRPWHRRSAGVTRGYSWTAPGDDGDTRALNLTSPPPARVCHGLDTFRVRGDRPDFEVRDPSQSVRTGRGRLTQHLPADRPLVDFSLPFDFYLLC